MNLYFIFLLRDRLWQNEFLVLLISHFGFLLSCFYLLLRFSFLLDVVCYNVWYFNSGLIIFVQQFLRLG
jgi:hypothetical protein